MSYIVILMSFQTFSSINYGIPIRYLSKVDINIWYQINIKGIRVFLFTL